MAKVQTIYRGGQRFYVDPDNPDRKLPGVTGVVDMLPKGFLKYWSAKLVAETAVEDIDVIKRLAERDKAGAVDYLKGAPTRYTKRASDTGTRAHDAFERMARGETVNPRYVSDDVKEHVGHYQEFLRVVKPTYTHLEEAVISDTYGYAGSFDAIGEVDGRPVILDNKTSKDVYSSVALQLAAYRYADRIILSETDESIPMPDLDGGMVLHVRPEGWKLVEVQCDEEVFAHFLHLLETFKWERETQKNVVGPVLYRGGATSTGSERRAA